MAYASQLKKGVDLPVWEWCRFAPSTTAALSAATACAGSQSRYFYYMSSAVLYRYDVVADSWQQLAPTTGVFTPQNLIAMQFSQQLGYSGRVISAGASTLQIAALTGQMLKGYTIRITSGTGAGQERAIASVADPVVADSMVFSPTPTTLVVSDNAKYWKANQWLGYQVHIHVSAGTGAGFIRKILSNTQTALVLSDVTQGALYPRLWGGTLQATPSNNTLATIESSLVTVSAPWDTVPDATSEFMVFSGGLLVATGSTSSGSVSLLHYDIVADAWYQKTAASNLYSTSGSSMAVETIEGWGEEVITAFDTGTASSATANTLVDSTKTWGVNTFANFRLRITGGTGIGQERVIMANSSTRLYVPGAWGVTPDATSTYSVIPDYDKFYQTGTNFASLTLYSAEADLMSPSPIYEVGVPRSLSATKAGWAPLAVTGIVRTTGGILTVDAAPTAGGSAYRVNEILTITTGGALGKVRVTAVSATGAVTAIALENPGSTYTTGTGKATSGGSGSGCTVSIQTIGDIATATTAASHIVVIGDSVTMAGAVQSDYNGAKTVLGANTATTFAYAVSNTPATPATFTAQTATLLVDVTKNWVTNEHVGKAMLYQVAMAAGISTANWAVAKVTANTATTLTLNITPGNFSGTGRYALVDLRMLGTDSSFSGAPKTGDGIASAGAASTLTDSTKDWVVNGFAGKFIRITAGTGVGQEVAITSNTATVITITGTWSVNPDATSVYSVEDCYGIATATSTTTLTDTTQNWATSSLISKQLRAFGGTSATMEGQITSNTGTVITGTPGTPTVGTLYAIIGTQKRGASNGLLWPCSQTDATVRGRYLYAFRGGAATAFYDRYNVNTMRWEFAFYAPGGETLTTGSMYAYDGADSIYVHKDGTSRILRLDLPTGVTEGFGTSPYAHGTAVQGNRMAVVAMADGPKFLYMMRHSGQEMWRALLFP